MNQTKKMKNNFIIVCLFCILLTGVMGIYGYYSDKETVNNHFSFGEDTTIIEEDFVLPDEMEPGISFRKSPKVTNTGNVPCYVRIFCELSDSRVSSFISLDFNQKEWSLKQSDGYYYYNKILQPGESTEPLFTTVKIDSNIEEDKLKDFNIIVYADTVQSEGYENMEKAFKLERKRGS